MPTGVPLINGQLHSAASVEIQMNGVTVYNVKDISYEEKQETTDVYGLQANPVGRTKGKIERSGSITIGLEEAGKLRNVVASRRLVDLNLTIIVTFMVGNNVEIHRLKYCKPKTDGVQIKSGDNELNIKLDLAIGDIQY